MDQSSGVPGAIPGSRRAFLHYLSAVGGTPLLLAGMSALGFGIEARAATPPKLSGGAKGKSVVVLGAGVAGLTSAYELSEAGYQVTLLEARERVGGRSFSARKGTRFTELGGEEQVCNFDDGHYINMGPWRIPYWHRGYLHYAKKLGVAVELFNNDNDHSPIYFSKGSGPLAGKVVRKGEIAADTHGYVNEILAKQINQGALDQQMDKGDRELFLSYLRHEGYLTGKDFRYIGTEGRGMDPNPSAGLNPGEETKPYAFSDILKSRTWATLQSVTPYDQQRTMFEPVGGMDQLPFAFGRHLGSIVRMGHVVEKISQTPEKVTVAYKDAKGQTGTVTADYCVAAIPLSVLKTIDMQVSPKFKEAMSGVSYALVGKIGIQMKTRFWEDKHALYGGHVYYDDPLIGSMSLPSSRWLSDKGVILAYYQFGSAAAQVSAKSPKERMAFAIEAGNKVFPEFGENAENSMSIAWHRIPFNMGGWAQWTDDGRKTAYPILNEPDGRIYLAGEHLSYLTGWQEGGIESAWQQIGKIHQRVNAA